MKSHKRKMIAPIVITIIMVLYCAVYFSVLIHLRNKLYVYLLGIVLLALAILMIAVCIERIREIKKGEEDDLSKY